VEQWVWENPHDVANFCGQSAYTGKVVALTSAGITVSTQPTGNEVILNWRDFPAEAAGARLRTTPWGTYLVGKQGYGKITWVAGEGRITLDWVTLLAADGGEIYPATFAALDSTQIAVLVRRESLDYQGKKTIQTHAMLLATVPVVANAGSSILWDEKILEGAPSTYGAMRDPSRDGRVVGHCGGRIFQISKRLPLCYALERFTPSSMRSAELIEHICQILQAVAVPDSFGMLHVISRSSTESVIDLAVDQVTVQETRAWENFFSRVHVSGEGGVFADAVGPVTGGQDLNLENHPLLWTSSGCMATASGMASWFGNPRRMQKQTWFWSDPDIPAPWESLPPLARVRINGGATVWLVIGTDDLAHTREGIVKATLVEVG